MLKITDSIFQMTINNIFLLTSKCEWLGCLVNSEEISTKKRQWDAVIVLPVTVWRWVIHVSVTLKVFSSLNRVVLDDFRLLFSSSDVLWLHYSEILISSSQCYSAKKRDFNTQTLKWFTFSNDFKCWNKIYSTHRRRVLAPSVFKLVFLCYNSFK